MCSVKPLNEFPRPPKTVERCSAKTKPNILTADPLMCTLIVLLLLCILSNWFIRDPALFRETISGLCLLGNGPKLLGYQQRSYQTQHRRQSKDTCKSSKNLQGTSRSLCVWCRPNQLCWPHQSHDLRFWWLLVNSVGGWREWCFCL